MNPFWELNINYLYINKTKQNKPRPAHLTIILISACLAPTQTILACAGFVRVHVPDALCADIVRRALKARGCAL